MSIEIRNLVKTFGKNNALNNVSLKFEDNQIYGLLGRNGAGKSTLLNIISNRLFATSGEVLIDGVPSQENDDALSKVYLMSEKTLYDPDTRIKHIFKQTKMFYPDFDIERAFEISKQFQLDTNKKVKQLSTGQTSIFKLAISLSVNTPYIFLDEPVLGLDANNRDLFYKMLLEMYIEKPCTIIISTHLIEEISSIIETAIMIEQGEIIINKSRDELIRMGYSVSGKASDVDSYTAGKEVIGEDTIGGLKTAYVIGRAEKVPSTLEIASIDLQKLFVKLTSSKEEK